VYSARPLGDWKLDLTTCKSEVYYFQLQEYDETTSRNTAPEAVQGESAGTTFHRRNFLLLQARVGHLEGQLNTLIEKQQLLVRSVSNGFQGDMHATIDHIAAINKSIDDIQSLKKHVAEHQTYTKGAWYTYLRHCNKDDWARIQVLRTSSKDRIDRLISTDITLLNVEEEHQTLRAAKAEIGALEETIRRREKEMVTLEPYAEASKGNRKAPHDDGDEDLTNMGGNDSDDQTSTRRPKRTAPDQNHRTQGSTGKSKGKMKEDASAQEKESLPMIQFLPAINMPNYLRRGQLEQVKSAADQKGTNPSTPMGTADDDLQRRRML
jgi:hypothetical protein